VTWPAGVDVRTIEPRDHHAVLALNEAHVELLAPLDEPRLRDLVAWAHRALVVELDGEVVGFVLTYAAGAAYDGENFAWFADWATGRHTGFAYLDRVVLDARTRRRGIATALYDELEAGCGQPVMCLEVNVEPPNEPSLAFHAGRGYAEVGRRGSGGHVVSLMTKVLAEGQPGR